MLSPEFLDRFDKIRADLARGKSKIYDDKLGKQREFMLDDREPWLTDEQRLTYLLCQLSPEAMESYNAQVSLELLKYNLQDPIVICLQYARKFVSLYGRKA